MRGGRGRALASAPGITGTEFSRFLPGAPDELSRNALANLAIASLEHDRNSAERRHASRPRNLALILALQPEVLRLALLSTVCASIANAIVTPSARRAKPPGGRLLLRHYPSETSRFILAASRIRRSMPGSAAAARLDDLQEAIAAAHTATIAFAAAAFEMQRDPGAAASLADGWRRTCRVSFELFCDLSTELRAYRIAPPGSATAELEAAVIEADQGGTPMLDATGEVHLPAWAELRRSVRLPVNSPATMSWRGREQIVRLTDISTGGAGIVCDGGLAAGDEVTIVVDPSIVMSGRVAWRRGSNAGIAFDHPFYDDSPELRFLARTGEPRAKRREL